MSKDKKCKDRWKVTVGLNCEQRIGVALENIGKLAHAHCQVHRAENYSSQVQVLNFQAKRPQWGHWCLYCYFVPAEGTVDIVDAVPIQTTKRGREWLDL